MYNIDLLSTNLLIFFCSITTVVDVYVFMWFAKNKRTLKHFRPLLITIAVGVVLALVLQIFISRFVDDHLPYAFTLMLVPFIVSGSLLGVILFTHTKRKGSKRIRYIMAAGVVVSFMFSLLIINNYYRYYPTVGQLLGKSQAQALTNGKEVAIQYQPVTQNGFDSNSIEASLVNIAKAPTAGTIRSLTIPGTISKFHARTSYVYIPAIYDNPSKINLPVLILMAGFPGQPENWLNNGLQSTMDFFASRHDGITPLVFVVDNTGAITNDTECVDSGRGNVETYLTKDVPNYITANFNVQSAPTHWAIGGMSLGGTCSIMLTLRHQDIFSHFIDLAGEVGPEIGTKQHTIDTLFNGSETQWAAHQPNLLLASHSYQNIGGFFAVGSQDELVVTQGTSQLELSAKKHGVETIYEVIGGQHAFNVWGQGFKDALPWISNRIGATQCGLVCI